MTLLLRWFRVQALILACSVVVALMCGLYVLPLSYAQPQVAVHQEDTSAHGQPTQGQRSVPYTQGLVQELQWSLTLLNMQMTKPSKAFGLMPNVARAEALIATKARLEKAQHYVQMYVKEGLSQENIHLIETTLDDATKQTTVSSAAEMRGVWVDRTTILKAKTPQGMDELMARLADAGFNMVFFEAVNGGYAFFHSSYYPKYPELKQWDPLASAITSAKKHRMQLVAWVWTMAVGNQRLKTKLPKGFKPHPISPLLTVSQAQTQALWQRAFLKTVSGGVTVSPQQDEIWLDPASPVTEDFLKAALGELVVRYPLDGVQFDYIRYPFQPSHHPLGMGSASYTLWQKAQQIEPKKWSSSSWSSWKLQALNTLMGHLTQSLRQKRPQLFLSAAVYPTPRSVRLSGIHQQWEHWLSQGYLDGLSPMIYPSTLSQYHAQLKQLKAMAPTQVAHPYWLMPGVPAHKMKTRKLIQAIQLNRLEGFYGYTAFSSMHLPPHALEGLKASVHRQQVQYIPYLHSRVLLKKILQDALESATVDKISTPTKATLLRLQQVLQRPQPVSYALLNEWQQELQTYFQLPQLSYQEKYLLQHVNHLLHWVYYQETSS
ncbi:MAG: glycoside hydrolase family 10 protein [Vampirovibrionales bacterium]